MRRIGHPQFFQTSYQDYIPDLPDSRMTSSKIPTIRLTSSSPPSPVRQLLTANLTAPLPLHFVAVTYILLVALMAFANSAPVSRLPPRAGAKRTILSGMMPCLAASAPG